MDGQPVWLCSVSKRNKAGAIIGTFDWNAETFRRAEQLAHAALYGAGDATRERAFRMNVTFCIHRAVSEGEKAQLPAAWCDAKGGLAGGPIEVLWSKGIEHRPASKPCVAPGRMVIIPGRPDLWVPEDCGTCEPCLARAAIEASIGA